MRLSSMHVIHFGPDGWCARLGEGEDFNDDNVARVADAAGAFWAGNHPGSTIYIGYDTRREAARFARLAGEVIASHGLRVLVSGEACPSPAVAWAINHDPASFGGLVVTASHRPGDYLGIRLREADGCASPEQNCEFVEQLVESGPTDARGEVELVDLTSPYVEALRATVDASLIGPAHLRVVVDPMYGSARDVFPRVLSEMGVEVHAIHTDPVSDFRGIHPEPVEPWVDECEQAVVETGSSAGLVCDGDGDRVGAIDETGSFVGAQKILNLLLWHLVKDRAEKGRVVITLSGSESTRRLAKKLGCSLSVTPIGFQWVHGELRHGDVILGGEETGGIMIPSHMPARDAIAVHLLLCELMATTGQSLGELLAQCDREVGHMDFARRDLRLDAASIQTLRNVLPGVNPASLAGKEPCGVTHADGLRLAFDDGSWVLLRPSNTEALVRVYAEASSVVDRDALLDAGCALARGKF